MAVSEWGVQPTEAWGMTLKEWWSIYDFRVRKARGENPLKPAPRMSRSEFEELERKVQSERRR